MIRKSMMKDIDVILSIYEKARIFMCKNGNKNQWQNGYPGREEIEKDIEHNAGYVIEENGIIVGVFSFFIGIEPDYGVIYDGKWNKDKPYGFIHRIASDGSTKNITKTAFDYAFSFVDYLRIDTHRDNFPMQNALKRYGFEYCGIIHTNYGGERLAFDCIKK